MQICSESISQIKNNIFDDFEKSEDIRKKFENIQKLRKTAQVQRKSRRTRSMVTPNVEIGKRVDLQYIAAKNYLKDIRSKQFKYFEVSDFEVRRKSALDNIQKRFDQSQEVLKFETQRKTNKIKEFSRREKELKANVNKAQAQKLHDFEINKYWAIIDQNFKAKS